MSGINATILASMLLLSGGLAVAGEPGRGGPERDAPVRAHAEGLSLDEAVAKVEAQYGARAVRAEEDRDDERRVYRIRLLSEDGRVFDVTVDAASGKVE